ncbi:MAG: histidine--tRNA ligase [Smithellaceae bacterium]|nr:histidine--tRNA ligase [Smithellaceae bacterium]
MKNTISAVKGFRDILPGQTGKWQHVEALAREIFSSFGFREIRIPILEKTALFQRSIGETTDIVEKEMYTFQDRDNDFLTLRPEATASVLRACIEHNLFSPGQATRLYTIGPMFRRERPQKGRYRQFHQIDVELLGLDNPITDAEVILMLIHFLKTLGLSGLKLEINSLGCPECRPGFRAAITGYLKGKEEALCGDCRRRLSTNPLRIFDCKVEQCAHAIQDAPFIMDHLCPDCSSHFDRVKQYLDDFQLVYRVNPRMVRGLDYYTKTAFEVISDHAGAQNAVVGGGRYDGLIRDLGGEDIPGIGFAIGFDRLISQLPEGDEIYVNPPPLYIAAQGEEAREMGFSLGNRLRLKGIQVEMSYIERSLKAQMKQADRLGCRYALLLGDRELTAGAAEFRDMDGSAQQSLPLDGLEATLIDIITRGIISE